HEGQRARHRRAEGDALELKVFFSIGWLYGAWDSWSAQDFPNWACAPLACRECSRATTARQRNEGVTSLIHEALSRSHRGRIFFSRKRAESQKLDKRIEHETARWSEVWPVRMRVL